MIPSPRFILILSAHSNLLRAALVTRDLSIVASTQQTFQITETDNAGYTIDPAEVWYKTKRVIAVCLDIGRTSSHELAGLVLVTAQAESIMWHEIKNQVVARGLLSQSGSSPSMLLEEFGSNSHQSYSGTIATWLLWNLTGEYLPAGSSDFGKTRARSPFEAELPILAVLRESDARELASALNCPEPDRPLLGAARQSWAKIPQ